MHINLGRVGPIYDVFVCNILIKKQAIRKAIEITYSIEYIENNRITHANTNCCGNRITSGFRAFF